MTATDVRPEHEAAAGALAERLFGAIVAALELNTVYIGLKLGLYAALDHPATAGELAERAGIHPRYAREWLEQQAVAGFLTVHAPAGDPEARGYALPAGHAEALTREESPLHVAPVALLAGGAGAVLPAVLEAFRHGTGISFGGYGDDVRHGQGGFNRAAFTYQLAQSWLPAIPDLHATLSRGPARVLDVGCGVGWSSIALARAFPQLAVDGIDSDEASVADARRNAEAAGVGDRVTFEVRDAADPHLSARYDAAFLFEALHDMSRPVEALAAVRALLADGAPVIVMDENAAEVFTAPGGDIERLYYAGSVLHCLPVGMAEQPSAGTGALMRPDTVRRYAAEAGYPRMRILPIEDDFFRFYRLDR
jgi:SAM-dependent methyltransferase